jgi:hypothetical protein
MFADYVYLGKNELAKLDQLSSEIYRRELLKRMRI